DPSLHPPRRARRPRVPRRHHRARRVVGAAAEGREGLLRRRPRDPLVGRAPLGGRQRDERADLHQHPGARLRRRPRLPPDRRRLPDRPHRRGVHSAAALLPGGARHRLRAARAAVRAGDAALHLDRLHGHARARRLRARVRDGDPDRAHPRRRDRPPLRDAGGDPHPRPAHGGLHLQGRDEGGGLDGDGAGGRLHLRRAVGDRDPRAGGARRVGRDHRPGRRAGQAAR
ncbi:MAG: Sodium/solute symporter, partial [uncultured Gemmatimonadaceae bacterium]